MVITLRAAEMSDAAAIHELHAATATKVFNEHFGGKGLDQWLATRGAEICASEIEKWSFVVAEEDDQIIAFGALNIAKARIEDVFVHADRWRQGLGASIVKELERLAREAGLPSVTLQATGPAILFYRKCGYSAENNDDPNPSWALMEKQLG